MKNRISIVIFLLLISLNSWAQIGGDYNPTNPTDPGNPTQEYTLTLKSTPTNGGSFNISSTNIAGGKTYTLRAYPNSDFAFVAWICNGDTLSRSTSYTYTMPFHDVEMIGAFIYSPSNPSDPNIITPKHKLTLKAVPTEGGSFNTTSTSVSEGEKYNLRAYPNTDFAFQAWICNGDTLSKSASYDYVMPTHDVDITGIFTYRPSSPSDPQEQALKYQLSISATPINSGSFNISNERLTAGSKNSLRAYSNTDFVFRHWMIGDSVLSSNSSLEYVMPPHNVQMVGVFEYNPTSPANPNRNHWDKNAGEVIVDDFTPGNLSSAISSVISGSSSKDVQIIIVAGKMNSNDFGIANTYSNCTLLDLSRVTGVSDIPSYAFDYTNLQMVYLPASIEEIGDRAFAECPNLTSITIYAMTPPTLGSNVFYGIPEGLVVYVPAAAIAQYQDVEAWDKFTLLPIQEDIRNISISLPEGTNVTDYSQMWLELTNTKSGQKMHYVMTDRTTYTFSNIIRNTSWNAVLRNQRGDVFGKIENIEVKDEDVSVVFSSLSKPQNVSLTVKTPNGETVTSNTQITWLDSDGNYLAQSTGLSGLLSGYAVNYRVVLSQDLAMQYVAPEQKDYIVSDANNNLTLTLEPIQQVTISGCVKDLASRTALSGATVTASQTFGGKYSKTVSTKTDAKGNYVLTVSNVPTSLAVSASDYISQTIVCDSLLTGVDVVTIPDVSLKGISGAVVTLGLTYTKCPSEDGDEDTFQEWYADYNNVAYDIFNKTKQKAINQFNVQYPQIVLLEEVDEGDVLEMTATSKVNAFMPVKTTATIDAEQRANASFNIVELGKIKSAFAKNSNASVVGSLYDANGKLVKSYDYSNASLTINDLTDGSYTLVTMGASKLFNSIYDLSQLPQTGLVLGSDYTQTTVDVKSGKVCAIDIMEVPTLDESKLYYTGDNTSFTVNKSSIVAGNYLTLTGHLDFKSAYAGNVSNVNLIVDLPESCEFVENSVMVGNNTSSYIIQNNRITIPMARYTDRVRFCIIPTLGGEYAPSALAQFDIDGETITQPIGSANYTAKDLSISVPSTVAKTTIPVSGTAIGASAIEIYDGDVLIGQTNSLANGSWSTKCELLEPYNLSNHNIYAKITSKTGLILVTETQKCLYDINAIEVKTVTMINTAHTSANLELYDYVTTFDLQNPATSIPAYWYWPNYPDFTFIVDFTNNDTTLISDVELFVFTSDGKTTELEPKYDEKLDKYVATGKFYSDALPTNVSTSFQVNSRYKTDVSSTFNAEVSTLDEIRETAINNAINKADLVQLTLILDEDSVSVFKTEIPSLGIIGTYQIEILDYQTVLNRTKTEQFDFEKSDSGYIYTLIESTDGTERLILLDTAEELAYAFSVSDDKKNRKSFRAKGSFLSYSKNLKYLKDFFRNGDWIGAGYTIKSGLSDLLGLNKYTSIPSFSQYFDIMDSYMSELESMEKVMTDALTAQCIDNTYRLSPEKMSLYATQISNFDNNIGMFYDVFVSYTDLYKEKVKTAAAIDIFMALGSLGIGELAKPLANSGRILKNSKNANYFKLWISNPTHRAWLENALGIAFGEATNAISNVINPEEADFEGVENEMNQWMVDQRNSLSQLYRTILSNIKKDYKKCTPKKNPKNPKPPKGPDAPHIMDPSGYVYEGVTSNRLEGVTATAYYKEMVEDMYGDLHENIVKWDAAEYTQENPLFTDKDGMYAWDVPDGLWQVKFEKEGYETTYSEWLPVPPPQLDINIAMTQNVQPNVKNARAYEDAVEVEFDKYMMPELLNTDNIILMAGDKQVEGTIELLNEEAKYEGESETFASKVRFNADAPFEGTEVTLMVNNRVKSYAGIRMQDNYSQSFTIEQEIRKIVCDSATVIGYGHSGFVPVTVLPASASAGKVLNVNSSSSMILATDITNIKLDENGFASISVNGELPGTAALTFSIDGYDLSATTIVNVEQIENVEIEAPRANIASGTTVTKGTSITLSCATEGATIYYTLDGSCPCDEATRLTYTEPIVINKTVTIKAMAVAPDMTESDIVEFTYFVTTKVEVPTASLPSGSSVYRGTTVKLSSESKDMKIWYTTDGTSPDVENGSRKQYTEPVVISSDMTLKAMTENEDGETSDVATFIYTILQSKTGVVLNNGWTWVSFNMKNDALSSVNTAMASGSWTSDDVIKDNKYVDMYSVNQKKWIGTLSKQGALKNTQMYKVHSSKAQTVELSGEAVNPAETSITVGSGWNYISYLPLVSMSVSEALSNYAAQSGDVIKSQDAFATYSTTNGWEGDLTALTVGRGYMLKRGANASQVSFTYPVESPGSSVKAPASAKSYRYADNMNIIGEVEGFSVEDGDSLVAYVNGEIRGASRLERNHKVFLTVHGEEDARMTIVLVREGTIIATASNIIGYQSNNVLGTSDAPTAITFITDDRNLDGTIGNVKAIYSINGIKMNTRHLNNIPSGTYIIYYEKNGKTCVSKFIK